MSGYKDIKQYLIISSLKSEDDEIGKYKKIKFEMGDRIRFVEMNQHHLDGAARVLTRSFLQLNDIWKTLKPTYNQVFPVIRGKIVPALKSGWSFVMLKGSKIIAVSIQYDLIEYLKMPNMPSNLQLFKILAATGKNLDAKLDYSQFKAGDVTYGLYGVMDPDEAGKGYALLFWYHQYVMGKVGGWKYYYSRISSPVSLKLLQRLGAEILAQTDVVGFEGKHKMWMIRIDFSRPFFSYAQLNQFPSQPKPKI